jgi:hypothetical protein
MNTVGKLERGREEQGTDAAATSVLFSTTQKHGTRAANASLRLNSCGGGKRVPYKPEQLPFIEYKDCVSEIKKKHDMDGGGYPLYIEVYDKEGQKLTEQEFRNVYDHKSEPKNVATDDWSPPLSARIFESRTSTVIEKPIECEISVRDSVPGDQLGIEALLNDEEKAQWQVDFKEARRLNAADINRRERELKAEIERKTKK